MNGFLRINFLLALFGTLGSLYFSEVMHFPPCVLCWYQRIFFYPLALVFGSAVWTQDRGYRKYAFPIVIMGLAISTYHNLLYYGFISEALTPCTQGVSCSSKQLELFGFITIPLLSMLSFVLMAALIVADSRRMKGLSNEK